MPTEVILPKVDMDMATGQISRWFYKEGDAIRKGEPLFEIETDKAAMEVDAPASGTLRGVTGAEGVDIAVGSAVAWIYAEGEQPAAMPAADAGRPTRVGPDPDVEVDSGAGPDRAVDAAPSGGGTPDRDPGSNAANGGRRPVRATPLARRLARERGIDLSALKGRGPSGRVQREDVEEAGTAPDAAASVPRGGACARRAPEPAPAAHLAARATAVAAPLHAAWLREGQGTPIVMIHGFASEMASWRPLLSEFGTDAPVLGIDLAGHGGSVDAAAADFASLVSGVEATLASHGIASCHLLGHSLGGAVATAVAAGVATTARSLMLIAPAGFGPDIDTNFAEGFARATEEAPVRAWLRHLVSDPAVLSDGFVRATARARADGRQAAAQTALAPRLFSNGAQHFEVRGLLDTLGMPAKIVAGTEDRVVPVRHFDGLPGRVALHLFARTGHMPQIEARAEVARLVRELAR